MLSTAPLLTQKLFPPASVRDHKELALLCIMVLGMFAPTSSAASDTELLTAASPEKPTTPPKCELLFQDMFKRKLGEGWSWIRENPGSWQVTDEGLQVRVEPGNMWGGQNNARNLLIRALPEPSNGEILVMAAVENKPTEQYEQVDLVWYCSDSDQVKLGQELVNGQLSIVMGREEKDQTRTINIIPLRSTFVRLRLRLSGDQIQGEFQTPESPRWNPAGTCDLPSVPTSRKPRICLQFYQGPAKQEHWARITEFRIERIGQASASGL